MTFSPQLTISKDTHQNIYKSAILCFELIHSQLKKNSNFEGLDNNIQFADEPSYPTILNDFGLVSSSGKVVGVAMHHTTVIEGEPIAHHLFYDIDKIWGLIFLNPQSSEFFDIEEQKRQMLLENALNIAVHELGHVHYNNQLLSLNSNMVLNKDFDTRNLYTRFHHSTKKACLNEYLACTYASSHITIDQPETYNSLKENVLIFFRDCPVDCNKAFESFLQHNHFGNLMQDVYMPIALLLKNTAYLLGHIHGLDTQFEETDLHEELKDTWYVGYVFQLEEVLSSVFEKIQDGEYTDEDMDDISLILDDMVNLFGIKATPTPAQNNVQVELLNRF